MQLFGILFFALTIPLSAVLAERGRRRTLIWVTAAIARLRPGAWRRCSRPAPPARSLAMAIGLSLMGMTYGPLGTVLSELFPTAGPLHRQLADVQPRRHLRRVARAVHRDLAGEDLRPAVRRLLPHRRRAPDARRPAGDTGNERRHAQLGWRQVRRSNFEVRSEVRSSSSNLQIRPSNLATNGAAPFTATAPATAGSRRQDHRRARWFLPRRACARGRWRRPRSCPTPA